MNGAAETTMVRKFTDKDWQGLSIGRVDQLYFQEHLITLDELREYVKLWNDGPHFCRAIIGASHIRLVDKGGAK